MAIVYEWEIANIDRRTVDDAAIVVHCKITAKSEEHTSVEARCIELDPPDPETMIPFYQLNEEIVLNWVKEKLGDEGVEQITTRLNSMIKQRSEPAIRGGLPWVSASID